MTLHNTKKAYQRLSIGLVLWLGLLSTSFSWVAGQPAQAASAASWVDSGLKLPSNVLGLGYCVDAAHPGVLLVNAYATGEETGLFAYNWQTHQRTKLSDQFFTLCTRNGFIYTAPYNNETETYRLSLDDPQPRKLDHRPEAVAEDGSLLTYSLSPDPNNPTLNHLWVSEDGGLTWQERGQQFGGNITEVTVSAVSGRTLYVIVYTRDPNNLPHNIFTFYVSSDAGQTWAKSGIYTSYSFSATNVGIGALPGITTPVDTLELFSSEGGHDNNYYQLSTDGGATFGPKFSWCTYDCGDADAYSKNIPPCFVYSYNQLLTFSVDFDSNQKRVYSLKATPTIPNITLATPVLPAAIQNLYSASLEAFPDAPTNLLLSGASSDQSAPRPGWYSPDQGQTWQALPNGMNKYLVTPYLPLTLLGINSQGELFSLDLSQLGAKQTKPTLPNKVPNGNFYPDTGHNMSELFKQYWIDHGGLAQFGYPRTEAFREYNPADGKIYTVQYFERNRFEYHPEFKGTPYEVELGLLGNQLTEDRRANRDGAFNHFDDMHYPGGTYFAATGHNLRNSFKTYWEQHGGLAIYGYPISEEFYEKNPDDGQTYVVQYFERNRFEYHPEYKDTSYEVELGLLGNTLLKQKGWL